MPPQASPSLGPNPLRSLLSRSASDAVLRTFCLILLVSNLPAVSGAAKRRKKRRSSTDDNRRDAATQTGRFLTVMKLVFVFMFAPVLIMFTWSVYKDPATPQIGRALWNAGKKKTMGYLGKGEDIDLENKRN